MTRLPAIRLMPLLASGCLLVALLAGAPARADLDVVFVLDTTGSMGGEIGEAQQRLRELAAALATSRAGERLRFGVVAFRDRGDDYVTKTSALTAEIGMTDAFLAGLSAGGGGDNPESVLAALAVALRDMRWDPALTTERRIVLVGDAPAHLDYPDEATPEQIIEQARREHVVIDAIGCRSLPPEGVALFRRLAYTTEGSYQHIGRVVRPDGVRDAHQVALGDGGLVAAVGRAASTDGVASVGEPLTLTPLGHRPAVSAVLLARTVEETSANGTVCALEVLLPPGLSLAGDLEARRLADRLLVRLPIREGDGGEERFALASCLPSTLPVEVELEGGR
jgi:Mg-chelatase subunit ChlD